MAFKISQMAKLASITAIFAVGLSFGVLIPKGGIFNLSTTTKPVSDSQKLTSQAKMSASAHAVTPATKQEIPTAFQGKIIYQAKLNPSQKVVALTFDDGPSPKNTAQVLEILKKNQIKATFFMVGDMVRLFPQAAKQVAADGHVIGNHTWHHWYRRMDAATAASEINRTADIIYKTTGVKTTLFRPPGGFLRNGLVDYAKSQKYAIMMWSDESADSRRGGKAATLVKNVTKGVNPGAIVLMHDGGGNRSRTVQALPEIITNLKKQGYKFVTIPELLEIQAKDQNFVAASPMAANQQQPKQQK